MIDYVQNYSKAMFFFSADFIPYPFRNAKRLGRIYD